MRVVVDTNVFISGVFFSGLPYEILNAWRTGRIKIVLSKEILSEYRKTGDELAVGFPGVDIAPWIELLALKARLVRSPHLEHQVCSDPDDDKFLACALASRTKIIITGDKALLSLSGFKGISIMTPRQFVEKHLKKAAKPPEPGK